MSTCPAWQVNRKSNFSFKYSFKIQVNDVLIQMFVVRPAAVVPMPMFSAYGASKAALSVFSHVMRVELSDWGVRVALIQPAGFRTSRSHDDTKQEVVCVSVADINTN